MDDDNTPLLEWENPSIVLARLEGNGCKTTGGWPYQFNDRYPSSLLGKIPESEFNFSIRAINQTLGDYYPCPTCCVLGYLISLATLGLSLLCGDPCTLEMERILGEVLKRINNRDIYFENGIQWEIKKKGWNVWIEIIQIGMED